MEDNLVRLQEIVGKQLGINPSKIKPESDFGTDKNTFKVSSSNIMQVEKTGAYNEIMRRLDPNADVGANVRR